MPKETTHFYLFSKYYSSSDDDVVAPRAAGDDNLLYLKLVQRMVALISFIPDRYVNVSIQFAMICRIQSPYFSMSWSVDVCVLTSFFDHVKPSLLWAYRLYMVVQNGTCYNVL